jgi:hypothetical protein
MPKVFLVAALLAATFVTSASAQSRSGTDKEQQACARDVSKFCRKVMNEPDLTVLACLKDNRPKISKACNAVLVSHGQ